MAFKKLLEELDVMAKSQTAAGDDDANIQAAGNTGGDSNNGQGATDAAADTAAAAASAAAATGAAGAGAAGAEGAAGGEGGEGSEGSEGSEGGEEGQPLAKSFEVDLPGGQKAQVIDAEELVKSLVDRIEATESETGEVLGACVALIKSQAARIDSLTAAVGKLAGSGSGRRAVLSVVGKNDTMTKSNNGADANKGVTPTEFLAKAETAFNGKAITGHELALAESYINRGEKLPPALIQKVMGFGGAAA